MKNEKEPKKSGKIADLHTRGVELRNEGQRIKVYKPWTWDKIDPWVAEYYEWKTEVYEALKPVSVSLAQRVRTLNRIPETGLYRFWTAVAWGNRGHRLHLRTLERRLEVIEEILAQWSGTDYKLLPHHKPGYFK